MKKLLLVLLILGVFVSSVPLEARADIGDVTTGCERVPLGSTAFQSGRGCRTCEKKYQDPAYYLQIGLNIMRYVGVIICIALSVVDFVKELLSEDKEGYKKVVNKSIKRLVYAIIIFVLPILVMQILKLIGLTTDATCNIV